MGTGHGARTSGTRQCPLGPLLPLGSTMGFSCTGAPGLSLHHQASASGDTVPAPGATLPSEEGFAAGLGPSRDPLSLCHTGGSGGSLTGVS